MKPTIKFSKIRDVKSPSYGTDGANGMDFFVPNDMEWDSFTLNPQQGLIIPSGLRLSIPEDHALVAMNKSSTCGKKLLGVGAQVVDADYQGEAHIHVINHGKMPQVIRRGEKLVQFLLLYAPQATLQEVMDEGLFEAPTVRGEGKFGSTGNQ